LKGFRSSKFPESSVLEAEFEAFQAAPAFAGEFSGYEALESETARNPLIRDLPEPNLPSWALDFQALQVNEFQTSPLSSSEFREQAPLHLTFHKGRHPQFARQGSPALVAQESHRQTQVRAPVRRINEIDYNIINHSYNSTPTPGLHNIQSGHQMEELFDDDALRQAFDAAEQSIDELAEVPQQGFQLHAQDAVTDQDPEILTNGLASRLSLGNVLGSERILENTSKAEHVARDENELARTAGELLDKFKYEKNPKFENSSFLTLMRQLRDREVHVEGDRLVDVSSAQDSFQVCTYS
jgi:hypothetical protein